MQREIVYDSLDSFIAAVKEADLETVIVALTDEIRSVHQEETSYKIGRHVMAQLLAYHNSTLLKCTIPDGSGDDITARLENHGLKPKIRNRNIV
jgi:hypothetical protein